MKRLLFRLPLRQCPTAQWARKDLYSGLRIRFNSTVGKTSPEAPAKSIVNPSRRILQPPVRTAPSKPAAGVPEATKLQEILIYHAGTGKIAFIGLVRVTAFLIFCVSWLVVAPAFYSSGDFHWYIPPAIAIGGSIPMLFVVYTTAPFVNLISLTIPRAAQFTRKNAQQYIKNVPRTAVLNIETMKFNFYFRKTQVALCDLELGSSKLRPVNLINTSPVPQPWWKGNTTQFYAPPKTRSSARLTARYFPEVWEGIFSKLEENTARRRR
ncbi:hypothetical protein AJ79_02861 [Helicocarpus griseus UAMH5409]|uniref:Uncharacterized protein n=1 Tax=Helicocarpus griseus UAMH5409 TaxID=1447875 RepID=A0A2B7Y0H8_9EURO|nr:hypothetical protein AJ79_02861 [Helicocarpus griseus UAMH5409]